MATISIIFLRTNCANYVHKVTCIARADMSERCSSLSAFGVPAVITHINILGYRSAVLAQKYLPQESISNAEVSARQQCVYDRPLVKKSTAQQSKEHDVENYIQWVTTLSLTIRVHLHSFSCCCLPIPKSANPANSPKIRTYSSSR